MKVEIAKGLRVDVDQLEETVREVNGEIASLQARIVELQRRVSLYRALLANVPPEARDPNSVPSIAQRLGLAVSFDPEGTIADRIEMLIRVKGRSLAVREILEGLESVGLPVQGTNPTATVVTTLRRGDGVRFARDPEDLVRWRLVDPSATPPGSIYRVVSERMAREEIRRARSDSEEAR